MPGIAGVIGKNVGELRLCHLNSMLKKLSYETFYGSNSYVERMAGVEVGWTYFNSVNIPPMPVFDVKKKIALIMVGQIFCDRIQGASSPTDCNIISKDNLESFIYLYKDYDVEALKHLNGQYIGFLLDQYKNIVLIFNDRFGLGRVYFKENAGNFYFSSDAKALLNVFPECRTLNSKALAEILCVGCTLNNKCLYNGISILPAGSYIKINLNSNGMYSVHYYQKQFIEREPKRKCNNLTGIKRTLKKIMPRYAESYKPMGMSLTGGRDSRIILGYTDLNRVSIRSYTFASKYRKNRDEKLGRKIATICQFPHSIIRVGDEFIRSFPQLAEKTVYITDGLMDVTGAVDLFVNRIAREISPVRLTGNYGQEILEGYIAFRPSKVALSYVNKDYQKMIQDVVDLYNYEKNSSERIEFILSKQIPWHHYNRYKLESSQLFVVSPFLDNDFIESILAGQLNFINSEPSIRAKLMCEGNPVLAKIETDLGFICGCNELSNKLRGIFQELIFKAEYVFNYGMPDWLAIINYLLHPLKLERLFLGRHKFYHFRPWYRDELSDYIKEILLDKKSLSRDHVNGILVEKIVLDHSRGIKNYSSEITQLLTVELIYRKLLEAFD